MTRHSFTDALIERSTQGAVKAAGNPVPMRTQVYIEHALAAIGTEINRENDLEAQCRLQDTQELLRRAWHVLDNSPYEPNDLILKGGVQ